jgi:hypothetical protein
MPRIQSAGLREIVKTDKIAITIVQMILGEMVNLQKVNLPKTPTIAFWLFYAQVGFLAS